MVGVDLESFRLPEVCDCISGLSESLRFETCDMGLSFENKSLRMGEVSISFDGEGDLGVCFFLVGECDRDGDRLCRQDWDRFDLCDLVSGCCCCCVCC